MAPVDSRDLYFDVLEIVFISTVIKSFLGLITITMWPVNTPRKHETLTQCWPNSGSPSAMLAQNQSRTGSTPRVCRSAGGEYKSTLTQCMLNAGPASPVLNSIYSVLVSISYWRYQHTGGTGTML